MLAGSFYIDSRRPNLLLPSASLPLPKINRFDRRTLDNYSLAAKNLSDVLLYAGTAFPLTLLASSKLKGNQLEYLFMYAETAALNGSLTFLMKSATDRRRPYYYNNEVPDEERLHLDARKSFFSGHASHTAALSFFTARVYNDLYPDSRWRYWVWSGAIALPAVTGYLRVQAGRHYPSDVITGYMVGAGIGLLVPAIHKVKLNSEVYQFESTANGIALVVNLNSNKLRY